ncbi:MAG: hypothetical protein FWJ90_07560, partial [Actinomadura sp.]
MTGDGAGARTDTGRLGRAGGPDRAGHLDCAGRAGTETGGDLEGRLAIRVLDALLREDYAGLRRLVEGR